MMPSSRKSGASGVESCNGSFTWIEATVAEDVTAVRDVELSAGNGRYVAHVAVHKKHVRCVVRDGGKDGGN